MNKLILTFSAIIAAGQLAAANLSELYKDDFLVGAALPEAATSGTDKERSAIGAAQFNALTPENIMKWEVIEPEEGKYVFEPVDKLVEYAQKNKMKLHGHTFVWHYQTPDWVFVGPDGKPASKELLLKRMKTHIETVMTRYKGKVDVWDVVNEAFTEDGKLLDTKWQQIIGDDYIETAFRYARAADPAAKLCYNDFNMYNPAKRKGVIELVKKLQKEKLIDLVGEQGHWDIGNPDIKQVEALIKDFAEIGIPLMVTELDIDVLPGAYGLSADLAKTNTIS